MEILLILTLALLLGGGVFAIMFAVGIYPFGGPSRTNQLTNRHIQMNLNIRDIEAELNDIRGE